MKSLLSVALLLFLLAGAFGQELSLADALDDDVLPTPAKPKEQPKAPEKPKSDDNFGLSLEDALGPDPTQKPAPKPPSSGGDDGFDGFNLGDALGPGPDPTPKPNNPAVNPPSSGGGGGTFGDSDLHDVSGGDYKPDGGKGGRGAAGPGYDPHGGADQPQEASGPIAGIVSAIGVALLGAASSYFAYQKKKLCFKLQGGADPDSGKGYQGTQSDPQASNNLLRTV